LAKASLAFNNTTRRVIKEEMKTKDTQFLFHHLLPHLGAKVGDEDQRYSISPHDYGGVPSMECDLAGQGSEGLRLDLKVVGIPQVQGRLG
jgi:hypothetical protein